MKWNGLLSQVRVCVSVCMCSLGRLRMRLKRSKLIRCDIKSKTYTLHNRSMHNNTPKHHKWNTLMHYSLSNACLKSYPIRCTHTHTPYTAAWNSNAMQYFFRYAHLRIKPNAQQQQQVHFANSNWFATKTNINFLIQIWTKRNMK